MGDSTPPLLLRVAFLVDQTVAQLVAVPMRWFMPFVPFCVTDGDRQGPKSQPHLMKHFQGHPSAPTHYFANH